MGRGLQNGSLELADLPRCGERLRRAHVAQCCILDECLLLCIAINEECADVRMS